MLEQSRKTKTEARPISELSDEERVILYYFLESSGGKDLLQNGYDESLPIEMTKGNFECSLSISLRGKDQQDDLYSMGGIVYHSSIFMVRSDVALVKTQKLDGRTILDDFKCEKQSPNHILGEFSDFVRYPFTAFKRRIKDRV